MTNPVRFMNLTVAASILLMLIVTVLSVSGGIWAISLISSHKEEFGLYVIIVSCIGGQLALVGIREVTIKALHLIAENAD